MTPPLFLETKLPEIRQLCRVYGVRRLRLFGSAARGGFELGRSDVDLLVELDPLPGMNRFQQFIRLQMALEELLGHSVDLVSATAVRDSAFRASAENAAIDLYAA